MKPITPLLALALLAAAPLRPAAAQDPDNEAKYHAKLRESFVTNVAWEHSFAEARREAVEKRMLVFGYFSRSYAP